MLLLLQEFLTKEDTEEICLGEKGDAYTQG